jgi:hypothetical protein
VLPASRRGFHQPSPLEPVLKMEVGGVLCLPLCVFGALQLYTSRRWNFIEIPTEAAFVATARNTIHPRKDVKVQAAHHIMRVVVVRDCWFPAECHLSPSLSNASAYMTRAKNLLWAGLIGPDSSS